VKQNFSQQLRRQKCVITWVLFQRPHMWSKLFYLLHYRVHGVTWFNSRWWLVACRWLMYALSIDTIRSYENCETVWGWEVRSWCAAYSPAERLNWF